MMHCLTLWDKYSWSKKPPHKKYFWALQAEKSGPGEFLSYIYFDLAQMNKVLHKWPL